MKRSLVRSPQRAPSCWPRSGAAARRSPHRAARPSRRGGSVPGGGGNIQAPGECGLGTGEPATGEPIKIGGDGHQRRRASTSRGSPSMTGAYFDCVNDNGGINGRPIEYIAEEEQVDPQQIASLATKLDRAGPGARHRRQHQPHRVQRQPRLLRRAGLLPDHRRRRPGLLHQPELLGRQHGPVLLEPRRRPGRACGPAPRARSSSSRRTSPGFDLDQQRRRRVRRGERAWRA